MFDTILADLRSQFGPKVLLDPADLATVIGISVGQQANLRSEGKFPIPVEKIGNRVKVSIYELAKYLSGMARQHSKTEIAQSPDKLNRAQKKATKGLLEKNWWAFRCWQVVAVIRKSSLEQSMSINSSDSTFTKTKM
ncbi:MAG: hypothetical protein L6Q55_14865 [Azonexus sp.]|nr:hypothetical protein [Azonexus sp.]MCK6413684.1 hypothetical protein [Azonexus sp.]